MDAMSSTPRALPQALPQTWTRDAGAVEKRDVWTAMKRGLRGRCPRCGEGRLFRAFLKVADACDRCGQDFSGHRADDLPAYLVIVIVGHIVVPLALSIETNYAPPVALQQPVKGAVVGLQWAFRMHGFDDNPVEGIPPV